MAKVLPWAWLNGHLAEAAQVRISPFDRGFLFADGVYEVIPVVAGTPWCLTQHLDRLYRSGGAIGLEVPDRALIEEAIPVLIKANTRRCQSLYLQVTRGNGGSREHLPEKVPEPTIFMMCQELADPRTLKLDQIEGISAVTVPDFRWQRCDIKSIALLASVMARLQALEKDAEDAIFVRNGLVTEASAANVFVVREGEIITPLADEHILSGITRERVLEVATREGLAVEEGPVDETLLKEADEIWLSSSTRHLVPVIRLNGEPVGLGAPGPVWHTLMQAYLDTMLSEVGKTHG